MHDLVAMRVFVTVAETQSFAAAARRLRLSTSVVSHHVAKLEGMLGVPLLNRSTRRVGLTEDGAQYFRRAKPLVDEADALFRETRECASDVSGRLKLAVPPGIAEHLILPPTLDFIREHPRLDVVLDVDPRQTDVIADESMSKCGRFAGSDRTQWCEKRENSSLQNSDSVDPDIDLI